MTAPSNRHRALTSAPRQHLVMAVIRRHLVAPGHRRQSLLHSTLPGALAPCGAIHQRAAVDDVRELMLRQAGVIARSQARAAGLAAHDIRRLLRRRDWAVAHPGVYVDHTGPLTWLQRSWAAVLLAWPAALCHTSALRAGDLEQRDHDDGGSVHVAVDRDRSVRAPRGIVVHRLADLDRKTLWNSSPPRLRVEEAALDVAAESATDFDAVAVLADAVQSRRTTPARLLRALDRRTRIRRRAFLSAVLGDVAEGACSVLEHAFLDLVERRHGLPTARRQVHESARGALFRDVLYEEHRLIVELDGRVFHSRSRARDRDLERDLDAALGGLTTVRLGWGQVVARPCATARKLAQVLAAHGWTGRTRPCPDCTQR